MEPVEGKIEIRLSEAEWRLARKAALERQKKARERNAKPRYGAPTPADPSKCLRYDMQGTAGEIAVCKLLGVKWDWDKGTTYHGKGPDIRDDIEVRCRSKPWYDLIVHKEDPDDLKAVLVIWERGSRIIKVIGWLPILECKKPEWLRANIEGKGQVYFVPQSALRPIQELLNVAT